MKSRQHLRDFERVNYVHDDRIIDCSLGVNPFGAPPRIMAENLNGIDILNYPDADGKNLRKAIAKFWQDSANITLKNIALGCGSICVLEKINKAFIDFGDAAYGYAPQFVDYKTDLQSIGGVYTYMALSADNNWEFSTDEFINGIDKSKKLVYIDNPNNPTGQIISINDIMKIARAAQKNDTGLIVDEAYGEFMAKGNSAISLIDEFDNIAVVRTFSKGFSLPGLRIGYVVSSKEFIDCYNKVNLPFMVNSMGLRLAELALDEYDYVKYTVKRVYEVKSKILSEVSAFKVAKTDAHVPIMLLKGNDGVNMYNEFKKYNVIVTSCDCFDALDSSFARLRVPGNCLEVLINAIRKLQA
jgi:histidinol-phosphate aminotransferase